MNLRFDFRQALRAAGRLVCLLSLALAGMASSAGAEEAQQAVDSDPFEGFNRKIFWFNETVDEYLLEPVAKGWDWATPELVRDSLERFFENLKVPVVTVNSLLQGKPTDAGVGLARFLFNSTVGFAGFFDPAQSELGLKPVREDFGQTLGVWGIENAPYLVLPLLGPSTPRDAIGSGIDGFMAVYPYFVPAVYLYGAQGLDVVNSRARLLVPIADSRKAALDYYVFVRNAYLQYRRALVNDQELPAGGADEDLYQIIPGN